MVRETSDALSWTLDNVGARGGDPAAVALVGHSAGAQLASMALLARASAAAAKDAAAAAGDADAAAQAGAVGSPAAGEAPAAGQPPPPPASASAPEEPGHRAVDAPPSGSNGSGGGGGWARNAAGRAGVLETAAYLHGSGTSFPDVAHSVAGALSRGGGAGGGGGDRKEPLVVASLPALGAALGVADGRMPAVCINMAGVYDIAKVGCGRVRHRQGAHARQAGSCSHRLSCGVRNAASAMPPLALALGCTCLLPCLT
eukprot:359428-Chlamydomonas_euryale.AAC.3